MTAHTAITADPDPRTRRYGPAHATGYIVTCEDNWQGGGPYYAERKHAQAEADYLTRLTGKSYGVEEVSTAACGLRHTSRVPELEAAARSQRIARKRQAMISRLVKRGSSYGVAVVAAQRAFPLDAGRAL